MVLVNAAMPRENVQRQFGGIVFPHECFGFLDNRAGCGADLFVLLPASPHQKEHPFIRESRQQVFIGNFFLDYLVHKLPEALDQGRPGILLKDGSLQG
ncbi:hypothetical protein D3C75_547360 [compost metagenome]